MFGSLTRVASGERSTIGAISSNGTANMSCKHECEPVGGNPRLEYDEQPQPDRVGQQRLVLGVCAVRSVQDRFGQVNARGCSRRECSPASADGVEYVTGDLAPDRAVGHRTWENFLAERVT